MIETMVPKSWYVEALKERDQARKALLTIATTGRQAMVESVASAICRYHDLYMSDRLTPAMTWPEAAYYVDALLAVQS